MLKLHTAGAVACATVWGLLQNNTSGPRVNFVSKSELLRLLNEDEEQLNIFLSEKRERLR
jgi:hypothetical protein